MKRSSFLKSLAAAIVSPSLVSNLNVSENTSVENNVTCNGYSWQEYEPIQLQTTQITVKSESHVFCAGQIVVTDLGCRGLVKSVFNSGGNTCVLNVSHYGDFLYNDLSALEINTI